MSASIELTVCVCVPIDATMKGGLVVGELVCHRPHLYRSV